MDQFLNDQLTKNGQIPFWSNFSEVESCPDGLPEGENDTL